MKRAVDATGYIQVIKFSPTHAHLLLPQPVLLSLLTGSPRELEAPRNAAQFSCFAPALRIQAQNVLAICDALHQRITLLDDSPPCTAFKLHLP